MNKLMNKLFMPFLLFAMVMCLTACGAKEPQYPWPVGEESTLLFDTEGAVTLTLTDGTLTASGARFLMKNGRDTEIMTGPESYSLQILVDGKWHIIEKYCDWTAEALVIPAHGDELFAVDFSSLYGELPAGKYRIIKDYSAARASGEGYANYNLFCEFEIK